MAARRFQEPELATGKIQGNILPGFRTDAQALLALRITEPGAAREWLDSIAGEVTTADDVIAVDDATEEAKSGAGVPADRGPWLNLGLSYQGLTKLASTAFRFTDEAFREGLTERSVLLGDPADAGAEGHRSTWAVGRPGEEPDVLLLLAGNDRPRLLDDVVPARTTAANQYGLTVLWQELGEKLTPRPSTEHFGFRDGGSQPAVRGRLPGGNGRRVLTPRVMRSRGPEDGAQLAAPGAPLVWPGSFVFGYPAQNPVDARAPGQLALAGPQWAENGSFLVFRRLRQRVDRFAAFLQRVAREHDARGLPHATPDAIGALLVGRWRSGAPVVRAPRGDDQPLAKDRYASNHFDFTNSLKPPLLDVPNYQDRFPVGVADPLGELCPNSAHIRKANPRGGYTEQGGLEDTLTRRILRRGIPYGPVVNDLSNVTEQEGKRDRGLHFLCYQTSITGQFEFLMRAWFNSPTDPRGGGMDLLIGQQGERARTCYLTTPDGPVEVTAADRWVIPTGGGYFFTPSVDGLRMLATGA
jgi:Dyp-type peroxidase family